MRKKIVSISVLSAFTILIVAVILFARRNWLQVPIQGVSIEPGGTFPDRDIVFEIVPRNGTVGFIDADGSGFEEFDLRIWVDRQGYKNGKSFEAGFTWTPDGKYLVAQFPGRWVSGLYPVFIANEQDFLICNPEQLQSAGRGSSRIWALDDEHVLTFTGSGSKEPILINMQTCEVKNWDLPLEGPDVESDIYSISVSTQNWVAVELFPRNSEAFRGTVIYDASGLEVMRLPDVDDIAWSPDGEWLAYSSTVIMRKDGSEMITFSNSASSISWSPDGEWIVYDRMLTIYKLNVETLEEVELFVGGQYPAWRPEISE